MSKHKELPYSDHALRVVQSGRNARGGGWSHFRHISVDGLSPVLVMGRLSNDEREVIVKVVTMPDGRDGYWRTPDARYVRKFARMVAEDNDVTLSSDHVQGTGGSLTHWTFRFNTTDNSTN